jgi:hypothetical protein
MGPRRDQGCPVPRPRSRLARDGAAGNLNLNLNLNLNFHSCLVGLLLLRILHRAEFSGHSQHLANHTKYRLDMP